MIIEIRSISGSVLYSSEATSLRECLLNAAKDSAYLQDAYLQGAYLQGAYLQGAYLQGAYLQGADLQGADLRGAYLQGAYLRGAYLRDADLRGAYLQGAYLQGDIKIIKQPIQVDALTYFVFVFDAHIKIGCEFHSISDWWGFDDARIVQMDGKRALEFWRKWKAPLQAICAAEGRE